MEMEQPKQQLTKRSASGNTGSPTNSSRAERLLEAVRLSAEACGVQLSAGAALLFVADLQSFSDEDIATALQRCRAELKPNAAGFAHFTVADVMERLGVPTGESSREAEALASWERISVYFQKYIVRTEDTYGERTYFGSSNERHITLTSEDNKTLRLIGGWTRFGNSWYGSGECMSFLRKDWLSTYRRVPDVEYHQALTTGEARKILGQLPEKTRMR